MRCPPLTCVLLLVFCTISYARPTAFESDLLIRDHDGVFRKTAPIHRRAEQISDQDLFEYEVEYHSNVIRLDQEHNQIDSVQCFSNDIIIVKLSPGSESPSFQEGDILVGGQEWGCLDENGVAQRFAVRVRESHKRGDTIKISTSVVGQKDVFKTLRLGYKPVKYHQMSMAEAKKAEWARSLSWNYDSTKKKADGPVTLYKIDCKSPEVKGNAEMKAVCSKNTEVDLINIKCSNCYAFFHLDMLLLYDQNDPNSKDLITTGTTRMNLDVTVSSSIKWTKSLFSLALSSLPITTYGVPGVASVGLEFQVSFDVSIGWSVEGDVTSGGYISGNFTCFSGSTTHSDEDHFLGLMPQMNPVEVKAKGGGSIKTTIKAGPHFKVYLFMNTFFNAYAEVAPYVSFSMDYSIITFPAKKSPKPKAMYKEPWMLASCPIRHLVEWDFQIGAALNVGLDGKIIPKAYKKSLLETSWDVAAGCLLPLK